VDGRSIMAAMADQRSGPASEHDGQPTLRLASTADVPAIDALMKASIREIFPAFYDERQTASSIVHVARVDTLLVDDGTYFVLEAGGEIVACGGWSRRDKLFSGSADRRAGLVPWIRRPNPPAFGRCSCAPTGRVVASEHGSWTPVATRPDVKDSGHSRSWRRCRG